MRPYRQQGVTLLELLIALAISSLVGVLLVPTLTTFQSRSLAEISRNDLQDRAERLLRFVALDLAETAFLVGPAPRTADGMPLSLFQDSRSGDPPIPLATALLTGNNDPSGHDSLVLVRAASFTPPIRLAEAAEAGATRLVLDRRPNRSPGSSREIAPAPDALNHIALEGQRSCYPVQEVGPTLHLAQGLRHPCAAGSELFGVRAHRYLLEPNAGTCRLRRDNFTSLETLDDAVDGLQFDYLLDDGHFASSPMAPDQIRAVRVHLLVRDLRPDRQYRDTRQYRLADQIYGPFHDSYRRVAVSRLMEVKNHGLL